MGKANLYSLFFAVPAAFILIAIYLFLWGKSGLVEARMVIARNPLLSLLVIVSGILLHELIHGLSWSWFGKKPLTTIKYGINFKALAPYAHCNEPLDIQAYRLGALMPGLLLGVFPALLGIFSGSGVVMMFGLLFTVAAGGDAMVLWLLRMEEPGVLVLDHPVNAGCYILKAEEP